jgi:uncharacterized protein YjaG (DUF416 family)
MENLDVLLTNLIAGLDNRQTFVASLLCTERILPLYQRFAETSPGQDVSQIEKVINSLWNDLIGNKENLNHQLLSERLNVVQSQMPDIENKTSYEALMASNVIICLDSAMRMQIDKSIQPTLALEFALETRRTMIIYAETGLLDVGSDEESIVIEKRIINHPFYLDEYCNQYKDVFMLKNTIDKAIIPYLRKNAIRNRIPLTLDELFGTIEQRKYN